MLGLHWAPTVCYLQALSSFDCPSFWFAVCFLSSSLAEAAARSLWLEEIFQRITRIFSIFFPPQLTCHCWAQCFHSSVHPVSLSARIQRFRVQEELGSLGSVPAVTGPVAGFALNKLPVGRAVSLGAIKIVKLFPYPLSHSGAALLLPLVWRARVRRPGRQRVLVCRVPGHPGESVVVHRQVSLPGGLPAQQDRHRDPASRRPAEEQRQKNQNKVKTEITVMNQQQSHFLTSHRCWQSSRWNRCGALLFKAAYYVKVQRRFIYVTMEQSTI